VSNKILVVDDDPASRKLLTLLLGKIADVLEAASGEEALRLIETERPRLMLLDMMMPGMPGIEVLAAAKKTGVSLTIIVLTGQNDIDLAKRAIELGAVEYITKPFVTAYVEDRVRRCVKAMQAEGKEDSGIPWRVANG